MAARQQESRKHNSYLYSFVTVNLSSFGLRVRFLWSFTSNDGLRSSFHWTGVIGTSGLHEPCDMFCVISSVVDFIFDVVYVETIVYNVLVTFD